MISGESSSNLIIMDGSKSGVRGSLMRDESVVCVLAELISHSSLVISCILPPTAENWRKIIRTAEDQDISNAIF